MSRNPYDKLARVREREKEVAERDFAAALGQLRAAKDALSSASVRALEDRPEVATSDLWIVADLDRARRFVELSRAESAAGEAEKRADDARSTMIERKTAADAMKELDERTKGRQKAEALKRELRELDELTIMRTRES